VSLAKKISYKKEIKYISSKYIYK